MNLRITLFAIAIIHQRMLYVCARHKHLCYSTMPLNTALRTGQVKCHAKYVENTSTHSILTGDAVGALVNTLTRTNVAPTFSTPGKAWPLHWVCYGLHYDHCWWSTKSTSMDPDEWTLHWNWGPSWTLTMTIMIRIHSEIVSLPPALKLVLECQLFLWDISVTVIWSGVMAVNDCYKRMERDVKVKIVQGQGVDYWGEL